MKTVQLSLFLLIMSLGFLLSTTDSSYAKDFEDVGPRHWAKDSIEYLASIDVVEGFKIDGTFRLFRPGDPVTRAQFLKMCFASFYYGMNFHAPEKPFPDVEVTEWYAEFVFEAKKRGFIDNEWKNYYPKKPISRTEAVKVIILAMKDRGILNDEDFNNNAQSFPFVDVRKDNPFSTIIATSEEKGVIQGYPPGINCDGKKLLSENRYFCPESDINRAEASTVIYRALLIAYNNFYQNIEDLKFPPIMSSKPDLIPKKLFFDSDNKLNVTIKNEGNENVPKGLGDLLVFVDGCKFADYRLSDIDDQSFRVPNGETNVCTDIRMGGVNRRIAVIVDSKNEIDESNEFQNTLSRTLTPTKKSEADFIINDIYLGQEGELKIEIENVGPQKSLSNLNADITINVNENKMTNYNVLLPSLSANGGKKTITPSPKIYIGSESVVLLSLRLKNTDEIDNTNNIGKEFFPNDHPLKPYKNLLLEPNIRNNIVWKSKVGNSKVYTSWSKEQKRDLNNAILSIEKGEPFLSAPPKLVDRKYFLLSDAWNIYIAHIAQSLWVQVHDRIGLKVCVKFKPV